MHRRPRFGSTWCLTVLGQRPLLWIIQARDPTTSLRPSPARSRSHRPSLPPPLPRPPAIPFPGRPLPARRGRPAAGANGVPVTSFAAAAAADLPRPLRRGCRDSWPPGRRRHPPPEHLARGARCVWTARRPVTATITPSPSLHSLLPRQSDCATRPRAGSRGSHRPAAGVARPCAHVRTRANLTPHPSFPLLPPAPLVCRGPPCWQGGQRRPIPFGTPHCLRPPW